MSPLFCIFLVELKFVKISRAKKPLIRKSDLEKRPQIHQDCRIEKKIFQERTSEKTIQTMHNSLICNLCHQQVLECWPNQQSCSQILQKHANKMLWSNLCQSNQIRKEHPDKVICWSRCVSMLIPYNKCFIRYPINFWKYYFFIISIIL